MVILSFLISFIKLNKTMLAKIMVNAVPEQQQEIEDLKLQVKGLQKLLK